MRTLNSGKNFLVTISLMVTMTLLGFVTRKLFVNEIGVEYLGLNGLLTNILAAVTLLESGFGTSVVFHLYKPLAENDRPRILALLQFYRKVYRLPPPCLCCACACIRSLAASSRTRGIWTTWRWFISSSSSTPSCRT